MPFFLWLKMDCCYVTFISTYIELPLSQKKNKEDTQKRKTERSNQQTFQWLRMVVWDNVVKDLINW